MRISLLITIFVCICLLNGCAPYECKSSYELTRDISTIKLNAYDDKYKTGDYDTQWKKLDFNTTQLDGNTIKISGNADFCALDNTRDFEVNFAKTPNGDIDTGIEVQEHDLVKFSVQPIRERFSKCKSMKKSRSLNINLLDDSKCDDGYSTSDNKKRSYGSYKNEFIVAYNDQSHAQDVGNIVYYNGKSHLPLNRFYDAVVPREEINNKELKENPFTSKGQFTIADCDEYYKLDNRAVKYPTGHAKAGQRKYVYPLEAMRLHKKCDKICNFFLEDVDENSNCLFTGLSFSAKGKIVNTTVAGKTIQTEEAPDGDQDQYIQLISGHVDPYRGGTSTLEGNLSISYPADKKGNQYLISGHYYRVKDDGNLMIRTYGRPGVTTGGYKLKIRKDCTARAKKNIYMYTGTSAPNFSPGDMRSTNVDWTNLSLDTAFIDIDTSIHGVQNDIYFGLNYEGDDPKGKDNSGFFLAEGSIPKIGKNQFGTIVDEINNKILEVLYGGGEFSEANRKISGAIISGNTTDEVRNKVLAIINSGSAVSPDVKREILAIFNKMDVDKSAGKDTALSTVNDNVSAVLKTHSKQGRRCTTATAGAVCKVYEGIRVDLNARTILNAMLVLFIALNALFYMMGVSQLSTQSLLVNMIKIMIVHQILQPYSWDFFTDNFLNLFIEGPREFLNYVAAVPDNFASDKTNKGGFAGLNYTMGRLLVPELWYQILSIAFTSAVGIFAFLAIVFALVIFFIAIINAIVMYFLATTYNAVLISAAPIFFAMILFQYTAKIFHAWTKVFTKNLIQVIFTFAIITLLNKVQMNLIHAITGYGVCIDCVLEVFLTQNVPAMCVLYGPVPDNFPVGVGLEGREKLSAGDEKLGILALPIQVSQVIALIICSALIAMFVKHITAIADSITGVYVGGLTAAMKDLKQTAASLVGMDSASVQSRASARSERQLYSDESIPENAKFQRQTPDYNKLANDPASGGHGKNGLSAGGGMSDGKGGSALSAGDGKALGKREGGSIGATPAIPGVSSLDGSDIQSTDVDINNDGNAGIRTGVPDIEDNDKNAESAHVEVAQNAQDGQHPEPSAPPPEDDNTSLSEGSDNEAEHIDQRTTPGDSEYSDDSSESKGTRRSSGDDDQSDPSGDDDKEDKRR